MKKQLFFLILLFPIITFAAPTDSIGIDINKIACPNGADYNICGGVNADLHNKFVSAMKKNDAVSAIKYWNKMTNAIDGTVWPPLEKDIDNDNPWKNLLIETLFGTYSQSGISIIPQGIIAKKSYNGGILIIGQKDCGQDCQMEHLQISYIKYSKNGMIYISHTKLTPLNSKQYNTYNKLYKPYWTLDFENDIKKAFIKGKFNNRDTNAVYQKFIKSIR